MIKTSTLTLLFSLILLQVFHGFAQETLDPGFKPNIRGGTARVHAIAVQPDGKILVGGDFDFANEQLSAKVARFNPDGTLDKSFQIGKGFDRTVETIALQPDGKILVGGHFSSFNGVAKRGLCRLHPDGALDADFTAGPDDFNSPVIWKVVVTPANKILVAGYFMGFNGLLANNIVRLSSAGAIDPVFQVGAGTNGTIMDIVLQEDHKVIVTGFFQFYNGTPVNNLCRINPDGSVDNNFAPDLASGSNIAAVAVQPDKKMVVGGYNLRKNGSESAKGIIRLNEDGSWDDTFIANNKLAGSVTFLCLRTDNKIIAGGVFSQVNGMNTNLPLTLIDTDGKVDLNYNADVKAGGTPDHILPLADNEVLLAGTLFLAGINDKGFGLVKLDAGGKNVAAFTNAIELNKAARLQALAVQTDGKILVAGDITKIDTQEKRVIARLNRDGSLDKGFGVNLTDSFVQAAICQPDGKIILGGSFGIAGKGWYDLIRLNADGSLDPGFLLENGGAATIRCLALQPDGKILAGGRFSRVNGAYKSNLARFNADGTADAAFITGAGPTHSSPGTQVEILSLAIQQDHKILVGGIFDKFNGNQAPNLARLNPDGSVDHSFAVGSGSATGIYAIALQKDDKILVGGVFSAYNGANVSGLARLHPDGSVDNTFNPYVVGLVAAINVSATGKVWAGGLFRWANGALHNNIIRLHANGSTDLSFAIPGGANAEVTGLYRYADDGFLIAGAFSNFSSEVKLNLARVLPPPPAAPASPTASLTPPNQVELTWNDQASNELGYEIQRSVSPGSGYVSIDTTAINAATFQDKDLAGGTTYYYRIRAINSGGNSAWTAEVSMTTHKLDQILTFAPIPTQEYGVAPFALQATASSGLPVSYTLISGPATLTADQISLTGAGTVRLKASQEGNEHFNAAGAVSLEFTVNEANPTALRVSDITSAGLKLEWEGGSPEFRVLRKTTASSDAPTDGQVVYEGPAKTFTDTTGLSPNTAYFFTVYGKTAGSASYSLNNKKVAASTAAGSTEKAGTVAFLAGETGVKALPGAAASLIVTQASSRDGYIQVTTAANPTTGAALPAGVKSLLADQYWIVAGVGLEAGTVKYTLTLDVANPTQVSDLTKVTVLHRANATGAWSGLLAPDSPVQQSFRDNQLTLTNLSTFPEIALGVNAVTGIQDPDHLHFSLKQNYPNPFDKTTTIRYELKKQAHVVLEVIDAQGKIVQQLVQQTQKRGTYQVSLNGAGLRSRSVYFIRLWADGNKSVITALHQ